jgi:hypothetical protein
MSRSTSVAFRCSQAAVRLRFFDGLFRHRGIRHEPLGSVRDPLDMRPAALLPPIAHQKVSLRSDRGPPSSTPRTRDLGVQITFARKSSTLSLQRRTYRRDAATHFNQARADCPRWRRCPDHLSLENAFRRAEASATDAGLAFAMLP